MLLIYIIAIITTITIPFIIGVIQHIIEWLLYMIIKKIKIPIFKKYQRFIYIPIIFSATSLVILQAGQFYLVNGAYFLPALLSFGLYLLWFLLPYFNLLIFWKPKAFLLKIALGSLLMWTILIGKASDIIYLNEGGVSSRTADPNLKLSAIIVGGIMYIVLTLVQTIINKPELHQIFTSNISKKNNNILIKKINGYTLTSILTINKVFKTSIFKNIVLIVCAFMPLCLTLFLCVIGIPISSVKVVIIYTLIVAFFSLSNCVRVKSLWISVIRYFIYFLFYIASTIISAVFIHGSIKIETAFDLLFLLFPIAIQLSFIYPLTIKLSNYLKDKKRQ